MDVGQIVVGRWSGKTPYQVEIESHCMRDGMRVLFHRRRNTWKENSE